MIKMTRTYEINATKLEVETALNLLTIFIPSNRIMLGCLDDIAEAFVDLVTHIKIIEEKK